MAERVGEQKLADMLGDLPPLPQRLDLRDALAAAELVFLHLLRDEPGDRLLAALRRPSAGVQFADLVSAPSTILLVGGRCLMPSVRTSLASRMPANVTVRAAQGAIGCNPAAGLQ